MSTQRARTQQVNLVDPSLLRQPERLTRNTLLALMGAGAVLVGAHGAIEQYQLGRQLSSLGRSPSVEVAADVAASALDSMPAHLLSMQEQIMRGETLHSALAQNGDLPDNAGAVLSAVIEALPETVWLTELQVLGDKSLVISGGTLERPALATFSKQLEANPTLSGTPIAVVQLAPRQGPQGGPENADGAPHDGEGPGDMQAQGHTQPTHFAFTLATRLQGSPTQAPQ